VSKHSCDFPVSTTILRASRQRRFDVVVVWKFDRFTRSVSHLLRALETFNSLGIAFVSLGEQIDTSTPAGRMVFTVLGAVAELERSLIAERVRAGMRNARAKGKKIGRPPRTQLTPEDRKSIAEAYWCRKASFRQLAKSFDTSIGTVQRCALAHQKVFADAGTG
jgi:DNA invertase Pin-like site-specific DNA recombinase